MSDQPGLFDDPEDEPLSGPEPPFRFDGETYEPKRDQVRLTGQTLRVYEIMEDGRWRTLAEIRRESGQRGHVDSEAAISARLRDLRKDRFGGYTVERQNLGAGLWQYRVETEKRTALK